jgi:hydrogenase-4 component E
MNLASLSLYHQALLVAAALVLFTSFMMLATARIRTLIYALVSDHPHLYISALLTLGLKALLIPWMLYRLSKKLYILDEVEPIRHPSMMLVGGAMLVIFSYYVAIPIVHLSTLVTRNTIAVSMAVILLGMLLMVSRSKAVAQVVGFMSIENGLFFAAVVSTYGMPMIVELGIAFDVLVAMVLFGVFFFQIRASIDTLDVDRMNRLSEKNE